MHAVGPRSLSRRLALGGLGALLLHPQALAATVDLADWLNFRGRFVQANGRVIDTGNGGQSHTEGQGWAMLFAQRFNDRDSFERIHAWTQRVLRRPGDALHAWRCRPGAGEVVDDLNNATDGDVFIAWALLEAGARWNDASLTAEGTALAADILRLLMRGHAGRHVLIPSLRGFEHSDYMVVNPSYYIFPAFPVLAAACPDPAWLEVAADGLDLLRAARFGRFGLTPDWLAISSGTGEITPAPGWPVRFSFDAVRVPLYMTWAGLSAESAVVNPARWWADFSRRSQPAWVDLATGATSGDPAPSGMAAIATLTIAGVGGGVQALPGVAQAHDYYSAALTLLARLAWADAGLQAT